ncbi:MAG: VWA domain-containing protein [Candidatus Aminicenantes bacterium]|jgi:Ca-activated chloride channel family protein
MLDLGPLANFHFIRPQWLLMLIPTLLLYWFLRRKHSVAKQWESFISPHLLKHLVVGTEQKRRLRPVNLLIPVFILASLALSGPTWMQEPFPFAEDEAPLVIALDLSQEMGAVDIQPSRLERAKQKVRDLLAERSGARTALLAYAGSAHMILPLTDDPQILEMYLASLTPNIMPEKGKNAADALTLAEEMLSQEITPGTVLFFTNAIDPEHIPAFIGHNEESRNAVMILGIGTTQGGPIPTGGNRVLTDPEGNRVISTLDREGLENLSQEADIYVTSVTLDDSDVRRLNGRIKQHMTEVRSEDENVRWRDFGYFLLFPIALLSLFWFRRGWTVQWLSGFLLVIYLFSPVPAEAQEFRFVDVWLTADQQGRQYFEKGDYAEAALRFEDPLWKGIAFYYNKDYDSAIQQFSRLETAESYFNLGNAYVHIEDYTQAMESYEQALKINPEYAEAKHNQKLVQQILDRIAQEEEKKDERPQPGSQLGADEIKMADPDDPTKRQETEGEAIELQQEMYSDEQLNEMWMRRVQTSPADFLRNKFAYQKFLKENPKRRETETQDK